MDVLNKYIMLFFKINHDEGIVLGQVMKADDGDVWCSTYTHVMISVMAVNIPS